MLKVGHPHTHTYKKDYNFFTLRKNKKKLCLQIADTKEGLMMWRFNAWMGMVTLMKYK